MTAGASSRLKAQEKIEEDLRDALLERRSEWINAPEVDRDQARQRFIDALREFKTVVVCGKPAGA